MWDRVVRKKSTSRFIETTNFQYDIIVISDLHNFCQIQGVKEKLCFFSQFTATLLTSLQNPQQLLNLQNSQHNASVQSLLLAGNFVQPIAAEGEVANLQEFLEKTQCLFNTLQLSDSKTHQRYIVGAHRAHLTYVLIFTMKIFFPEIMLLFLELLGFSEAAHVFS